MHVEKDLQGKIIIQDISPEEAEKKCTDYDVIRSR